MKIEKNIPLAPFGTMRVGGKADFFCTIESLAELKEVVVYAQKHHYPFIVLGGGTNMYFQDDGYRGVVIQMQMKGSQWNEHESTVTVRVAAGESWDAFVEQTVDRGLFGLENLSFIPGTVGASPIQNIGAYGKEVKDCVIEVEALDTQTGSVKKFLNEECKFEYRDSFFKTSEGKNFIITQVSLELQKNAPVNIDYKDLQIFFKDKKFPTLREVRNAVIKIRKEKLPDPLRVGTLGSFFKNPILKREELLSLQEKYPAMPAFVLPRRRYKVSAAWLIDHAAGLKEYRLEHVGTYERQPLAIVNYGGASAREIRDLSSFIKKKVREKTGIKLQEEVQFIG